MRITVSPFLRQVRVRSFFDSEFLPDTLNNPDTIEREEREKEREYKIGVRVKLQLCHFTRRLDFATLLDVVNEIA